MERILYDYHQAISMAETSGQDVERERYVLTQKVFEKHNVTEAQFDSSMVWYTGHANYLTDIYAHIEERLQSESALLGLDASEDIYANLTETGDTAVIWRLSNLWLRNKNSENLVKYSIHPDTSFHRNDTYLLRFTSQFVSQDNKREGYAILLAKYDNDSTSSVVSRVGGNYESNLEIRESALTREHDLRSLNLYFYVDYDDSEAETFRLWMIDSPKLIRFRHDKLSEDSVQEDIDTLDIVNEETVQDTSRRVSSGARLSPTHIRQSQQGEHKINIQKQRRVIVPAKPIRTRTGQRR